MRTKLTDRSLPDYTRGEEIFNMVSHIVGGGFGIIALGVCLFVSIKHKNAYSIVGSCIYGVSMIMLYTMSSVYHGLRHELAKKVFQVIDHCTIYVLIAGTYTPILLCTVRPFNPTTAWLVFGIVWSFAAIGITLNGIDLKTFRAVSMVLYLGIGWSIVFTFPVLIAQDGWSGIFEMLGGAPGFSLLFGGGLSYTFGSVLYGLGKKKRYAHSVFHLFVVLGSILHFFFIVLYVI